MRGTEDIDMTSGQASLQSPCDVSASAYASSTQEDISRFPTTSGTVETSTEGAEEEYWERWYDFDGLFGSVARTQCSAEMILEASHAVAALKAEAQIPVTTEPLLGETKRDSHTGSRRECNVPTTTVRDQTSQMALPPMFPTAGSFSENKRHFLPFHSTQTTAECSYLTATDKLSKPAALELPTVGRHYRGQSLPATVPNASHVSDEHGDRALHVGAVEQFNQGPPLVHRIVADALNNSTVAIDRRVDVMLATDAKKLRARTVRSHDGSSSAIRLEGAFRGTTSTAEAEQPGQTRRATTMTPASTAPKSCMRDDGNPSQTTDPPPRPQRISAATARLAFLVTYAEET